MSDWDIAEMRVQLRVKDAEIERLTAALDAAKFDAEYWWSSFIEASGQLPRGKTREQYVREHRESRVVVRRALEQTDEQNKNGTK